MAKPADTTHMLQTIFAMFVIVAVLVGLWLVLDVRKTVSVLKPPQPQSDAPQSQPTPPSTGFVVPPPPFR